MQTQRAQQWIVWCGKYNGTIVVPRKQRGNLFFPYRAWSSSCDVHDWWLPRKRWGKYRIYHLFLLNLKNYYKSHGATRNSGKTSRRLCMNLVECPFKAPVRAPRITNILLDISTFFLIGMSPSIGGKTWHLKINCHTIHFPFFFLSTKFQCRLYRCSRNAGLFDIMLS